MAHLRLLDTLGKLCSKHDCAILLCAGEDGGYDPVVEEYLDGIFAPLTARKRAADREGGKATWYGDVDVRTDLVLLITAGRVLAHCAADAWGDLCCFFESAGTTVDAFCPPPEVKRGSDEALAIKLEVVSRMLDYAAESTSAMVVGGHLPSEAAAQCPLLRALSGGAVPGVVAPADDESADSAEAARALKQMLCAYLPGTPARLSVREASRQMREGWQRMLKCLDDAAAEEEIPSVTEKRLRSALLGDAEISPVGGDGSGVWVGASSADFGNPASRPVQIRTAGVGRRDALHAVARMVHARQPLLRASRTLFFSNGVAPHHWQHRVFFDGEVLPPLVEDAPAVVERSEETAVLMRTYALLVRAAQRAMRLVASMPHTHASRHDLQLLIDEMLATARAHDLLPADYDGRNATLTLSSALCLTECCIGANETIVSEVQVDGGGDRDGGGGGGGGDLVQPSWLLHNVCVVVGALPVSLAGRERAKAKNGANQSESAGSLVFEDSFVLNGLGDYSRMTPSVSRLACWPREGGESVEARMVRAAVTSNEVCADAQSVRLRLRAGEHSVLGVLLSSPFESAFVAFGSPWLPLVRGTLFLFSDGIAFDCVRHGPLLLPFRIHLARVRTYNLGADSGDGLLIFEQKSDSHGYGPLALLPSSIDGDDEWNDPDRCTRDVVEERQTSLGLIVPAHSPLHATLRSVWPAYAAVFAQCAVPVETLPTLSKQWREGVKRHATLLRACEG